LGSKQIFKIFITKLKKTDSIILTRHYLKLKF
jgi:hypothetical protein